MSKFSLQVPNFYSARLSCPVIGTVETLMHVASDGKVVTVKFGVSKGSDDRVARIDVSGGTEFNIPKVGEEARERAIEGNFTRISAYARPLTPSARCIRRHSGDVLVIQDVMSVVDALAGEDYLKHEVRRIDVWCGMERLGSASPSRFAEGTGIAQALLARGVVHEAIVRLKGAPTVDLQDYDDTALRRVAPLGGQPESFPSEALAGEAPFGSYSTKVEGRPAAGLLCRAEDMDAQISQAISPLSEVRHPLMFGNLDRKLKTHMVAGKQNIVVTVGCSPGIVSKGLQDFGSAGGKVLGVVAHGGLSMKDTIVLPKGTTFGTDFMSNVYDHLGKSQDMVNTVAVLFIRGSGDAWAESGEFKLVYANQRLLEEATAFVSTVGRDKASVVMVMMTDVDIRLPDWVNFAYSPANMSLAVPHWMVGVAPENTVRSGGIFSTLVVDNNRRLTPWVMRALRGRKIPKGGYGDSDAIYPNRFEWSGRATASYERHYGNPLPVTSSQAFILPGEYLTISTRLDRLYVHTKESEQQHGFVKGKDASLAVPIEYHGSLLANKYLREQLGAPLPTQSAERVTPLSALLALLDDELYVLMELACHLMKLVGSPLHRYEVSLRVAALGTMTRVDAIAKLASFAAEAREVLYGNKTPKGHPRAGDLLAYAAPLMPFKSAYVTKATWALIQEAQRRGTEKKEKSRSTADRDEAEGSQPEGVRAARDAAAAFAGQPVVPAEVRGRGRGTARRGWGNRSGHAAAHLRGGGLTRG